MPVLGAVKTTSTIQRRLQLSPAEKKLVVGEVAGCVDGTAKREPPRLRINLTRLIGDPA